jgi:hypothetical protein
MPLSVALLTSRSLDLAVEGVAPEVGVVLLELQALRCVAAVLKTLLAAGNMPKVSAATLRKAAAVGHRLLHSSDDATAAGMCAAA